ncbi:hypothetical protein [Sphingomonas albertensis]|uniref:Uncharacterized protein n=1 Tax=Sphingomonas albertensis TaxID=2762591 RepID=A0ABR7AP67_9SPHN|nr:hypothetical protein [Sphingomonas albertensis]MBC3942252.1 hypothetical protein [Sphingomonas albertensis]
MDVSSDDALSLRSAIAWALHLADAQDDTLVAAILANALETAERSGAGSRGTDACRADLAGNGSREKRE